MRCSNFREGSVCKSSLDFRKNGDSVSRGRTICPNSSVYFFSTRALDHKVYILMSQRKETNSFR